MSRATDQLPAFPEDSIPGALGKWWELATHRQICRGRLIRAFVPHVGLTPLTLEEEERAEATEHSRLYVTLRGIRASSSPAKGPKLPAAALPAYSGEVHAVYRSKKRPVLVVGVGGSEIPRDVAQNLGSKGHPALTVAPYYGAEADGKRGGFRDEFVRRIARGEYPQYVYDKLPVGGSTEVSILRLDHLQPIGNHHESYELTDFVLCGEAMELIDEWLRWLHTGLLSEDGNLGYLRKSLPEIYGP